jgi:two-component system cell cycle sensor histidine kinase/response regulator CckA
MPDTSSPFTSTLAHHPADPFRLLVESVAEYAIYMVDPSGSIASWNPAAQRIYGYRADDIIGRPFTVVYTPEDLAAGRADANFKQAHAAGSYVFEALRVRQDGSRFWAVIAVSVVRDYFGNHAGLSVVTRDVTERKGAEDAIRRERDLSAAVLASLPGIYYVYDEARRFVRWNPAFEAVTGYSAAEVAAMHPLDLFTGPDRDRVAERIETVFRTGRCEVEAELVTRDGRRVPYFFNGVRAEIEGRTCLLGMGIDITSQRQADADLRRTAGLLRAVADGTPDGVFVKDRDGNYLLYNRAAARFVGKAVGDVLGRGDDAIFAPDYAREVRETDLRVMASGRPETVETELTVAGVTRAFQTTKAPYRDADGAVAGVLGISRDVTERKRAEERLTRSQSLLRVASRVGRMGAWAVDLDGYHVTWSEDLLAILDLPPDHSPDLEYGLNIYLPAYRPVVREVFDTCTGTGAPFDIEVQAETATGRVLWVRVIGEAVRDATGAITGAQGAFQDITDRKQTAEMLQLRDRAVQAVSQGILITDATRPGHPVVFANAGFERMTGYPAAEVAGTGTGFLHGRDTDPDAAAELRAAAAAGAPCSVELVSYRRDGTPFWNAVSVSPVADDAGRVTHHVAVLTDVTARRRLEEQFRQAQKMEAIGQLAGGVAHDFNNLLTVINGYSDLLLDRLPPGDPMYDLLAEIHRAGERAGTLTRQLLAFSRQQVLQPRVLDLNAVVADTEKMLRRLIGEDVTLRTVLAPALGRVKADPGQLEQVLLNLTVNARDAMPGGGTLTLETQPVRLDPLYCRGVAGLVPGEYALLAVSDTGCGMDAATRSRIFEPFFTTKEPGKGTGLGLATVHGIVKQSRGHVAVYSEVGYGTTFKVYLPLVAEPLPAPAAAADPALPAGTETVLLVEDDASVRGLAAHVLRGCGYQVLEATDGRDALRTVEGESGRIDLLVSDVVMPHLSGRALAERVALLRPDCRVLFLSGYTDDAVVVHGVSDAEFAFLQKPFTPSALAQKVRRVLTAAPRQPT